MLCKADAIGVFQVESRAQMNMLPRLKPCKFYDLVIEVAIVRPGPIQGDMVHPYLRRRKGDEKPDYPAPASGCGDKNELKQILEKTLGVPLFQEQAMRIAMEAAKFTDGEVNELRKAMATFRRRGTIGQLEDKMISRMVDRGYKREFAERCFNQIKGFGEYGFPESHAASFALLVYASAWIKWHYPAAFACALLNSQPMGFYAPAQIVRCAREHGVEVRAADINHSCWDCTLETGPSGVALRLGFRQIDGMSEADAERLMLARDGAGGRNGLGFSSVIELQRAAGLRLSTLERLAAADGMRSIGLDRRQALWEVKALHADEPMPLFAWGEIPEAGEELPVQLPRMAESEHVVADYQTVRLSLKAHPMQFLRDRLQKIRAVSCAGLSRLADGTWVRVAGVVLVRQRPGSAKGVVFMTIEDEAGIANAVVWPKTLERYRKVIMGARLVLIHGRIQSHDGIIHVVCSRMEDKTGWLADLTDTTAVAAVPVADAASSHPESGSHHNRGHAAPPRHPRQVRIIDGPGKAILPRSRDFH
jgi:error-prone DNA polymerase